MSIRKFGVPENTQVRVLTPPEYQTLHRWEDTVDKLAGHVPVAGVCGCGATAAGRQWAEHVTDVLYGHPAGLDESGPRRDDDVPGAAPASPSPEGSPDE